MKQTNKAPTPVEASPYKSVAEALDALRETFHDVCVSYTARVDAEIVRVRERVMAAGAVASGKEKTMGAKVQPAARGSVARRREAEILAQVHDLRDMLTLLRTAHVAPDASRRKDLKKIETLVEDLRLLVSGWA